MSGIGDGPYKQAGLATKELTITATDEEFAFSHRDGSAHARWGSFVDIEDFRGRVLMWMSEVQPMVVPRSTFRDEGEAERFLAFVTDRNRAGRATDGAAAHGANPV